MVQIRQWLTRGADLALPPSHGICDIKCQTLYSYHSGRHILKNDFIMDSKVFNHCLHPRALWDPKVAGKLPLVFRQENSLESTSFWLCNSALVLKQTLQSLKKGDMPEINTQKPRSKQRGCGSSWMFSNQQVQYKMTVCMWEIAMISQTSEMHI